MPQLVDIGLWAERRGDRTYEGRPALFLDRDGVIIEDVHFIERAEDVKMIEGVASAIAEANAKNVAVVIVTNQSGIARGRYGWSAFEAVQRRVARELEVKGAWVDLVLACGYHPDGRGDLAVEHAWRKPGSGMLLEAKRLLAVDLSLSFIVGDRMTDLAAGKLAGLTAGALALTGYGRVESEGNRDGIARWRAVESFDVRISESAGSAIIGWLSTL
jgi:D-glycero-D-manno-heptose 1,7-bisphosphate phosphatase